MGIFRMIRLYFKKTPVPQRFYYNPDFHDRATSIFNTVCLIGYPAYAVYYWENIKPKTPDAPKFIIDFIVPDEK